MHYILQKGLYQMSLVIGKENTFTTDTIIYENGDDIESIAYIIE